MFKGPCQTIPLNHFIYGYNDHYIADLYSDEEFLKNKEVAINSYITPIFTEKSPDLSNQKIGLFTGSNDLEQVSRVRFLNDKNYMNKLQDIMVNSENTTQL